MSYRFGGTTGDDLTWTESTSVWGTTQRSGVIAGWYYPTTLTAGKALWSVGAVNRAVIASTTSEINLFLDRTTDTQYTTSGLALAVNRWHFIAFLLNSFNTGPVTTWRVWGSVGTAIPEPVTVNQTVAGSGNATGNTIVTVGNIGAAGTSAFEGDIGRFDYFVGTLANAFLPNTTGLISAAEEKMVFEQVVVPIWSGQFPTFLGSGTQSNNAITHVIWDLDLVNPMGISLRNGGTIQTNNRLATVNAVVSENRRPIPQHDPLNSFNPRRR
jgi:hypothetical protein